MARKIDVSLVDDLDGQTPADETVTFSIDGTSYEIDLSTKNADKLRKQLTPWIDSSRRISGRFKGRRPARASSGHDLNAVREWARANNMQAPSRGRMPTKLIDAYESRNTTPSPEFSEAK